MYLLLDIGATKTKIGITKNVNRIEKFFVIDTQKNYKEFLNNIGRRFSGQKFKKIIIGFAGMVKDGKIIKSPNLSDFDNKNLKNSLRIIFHSDVILKNDAELAGLGETAYGAGRKYNIVAYITWSSGIGGVKICNKKVDCNYFGFEPGHSLFLIKSNGSSKDNFYLLEIEKLLGGKSIEKLLNKKPEEVSDKKFWSGLNKIFAGFLVNVALFWSPEVIIIGGSILKSINFDELKVNFENFKTMPFRVKILKSKLKEKAVLYGALFYLKNYL